MKLFKTIKLVLDEQYEQIHEKPAKRLEIIKNALEQLSSAYNNLLSKNNVSYADLPIRFAYVYRYVTCHSGMAFQVIKNSEVLRALFKEKLLTVSCIGGGPGSDLLGVLKYAEDVLTDPDSKLEKIRCYLVDGENAWADTWSDVDQKVDLKCSVSTFFLAMKVTEPTQWKVHTKYLHADLFTMVYFVSEIYSRRADAEPFFVNLLENMKPGAFLLYVDNNDSRFNEWIGKLASGAQLKLLSEDDGQKNVGWDEEKTELGKYFKDFPSPKLGGNASYRIWRKAK